MQSRTSIRQAVVLVLLALAWRIKNGRLPARPDLQQTERTTPSRLSRAR
jgi:hypothetical protein